MSTVIVTTSQGFGTVGRVPAVLKNLGWTVYRCLDPALPDGGLSAHLQEMDFMVVGLRPVTDEIMAAAPRLRAILKHGVGVDNIDVDAASRRGIPVLNVPGTNANAVAELALAGMLSLSRHIPQAHQEVLGGVWDRIIGTEIEGRILGIIGLGNIGRILARKARALGMTVMATDPYADDAFCREYGVSLVSLESLLSTADFVSVHVTGGKQTTNLIGPDQLARMKPSAYLMNYARGEVVDMDALAKALATGQLAGAALDAYAQEPVDLSHPIFKQKNVVFTPHSGADTEEAMEKVGLTNLEDMQALLNDVRPPRILNPEIFSAPKR